MDRMYLIVLFGIASVFLIIIIKKYSPEYAMLASLCAGIIIISLVVFDVGEIGALFNAIKEAGSLNNQWTKSIIKIAAISFLGQWGVQLCRDCGENSIADKIETGIKISVLVICIPYINMLFKMATEFS